MSMRKLREETELFYSYLRQHGLKKTYQKDLILETFLNTEGHLSVEDIYALVKKRDKKVGVVTVFRTLKSLTACGIAREISLGDGLTRFEHSYHHPAHHHIVCTKCHRAIEFVCPDLEEIQSDIIKKYKFQPLYHRFQTYGICEGCSENQPVAEIQKQDTERVFARDAIKMALGMQSRCLEFYSDSAKRSRDAAGRQFFEQMMQQEETHIALLRAKLDELTNSDKDLDQAPMFLHFNTCDLDALIPEVAGRETVECPAIDAESAMKLALVLNDKTMEYFKTYAEGFEETRGKRILLEFVELEKTHGDFIRQRIQETPAGPMR